MESKKFNRLLKSVKENEQSFVELYEFYYPKIVKFLTNKYDFALAEDVAQDFFMNLINVNEKQEYVRKPTTWVYTCVDNLAKRKLSFERRNVELREVVATENVTSAEIFMEQMLSELNKIEKKIIVMFYVEGYNQAEIAQNLDLKHANVRKIHSRAIKKLKKFL